MARSLTSKLSSSILLLSLLSLFTILTLFFYVHHSPLATTQFYNFTLPDAAHEHVYLVERPFFYQAQDEVLSYSLLNRFRDKKKAASQPSILLLTPYSRHFSHYNMKQLARKYNVQIVTVDLPGLGHSGQYDEQTWQKLLMALLSQKLKIGKFSIFAQGMASNYALDLVDRMKVENKALYADLEHVVLFSPWSVPDYDKDWNALSVGHHTLVSLYSKSPFLAEYFLKIVSQFGFATRSEYWYSNLASFLANGTHSEDYEMIRSEEWQPVLNNSFVELYRQGVGPFLKLYHDNMNTQRKVPSIEKPVQIYHATQDAMVPFAHTQRLQSALKEVHVESVPGSAHFKVFNDYFETALRDVLHLKTATEEERPHVFVVGGGLAGLSAAIEAEALGAVVTLLEKEDRVNGNSAKASSGINGVLTKAQKTANITDSYELFYNETMASGKGEAAPDLVNALVQDSTDAIRFFEERGINMDVLSALGGHSVPRTHRPRLPDEGRPRNAGSDIMFHLFDRVQKRDNIHIITNARATELIKKENNRIVGVKYVHEGVEKELVGGPVILATGGYSADREGFLSQYFTKYAQIPTSNGAFATGDGIRMAQQVGAGLKHMEYVQIHPTCFLDPKDLGAQKDKTLILAAEALRAYGAILLNHKGHRFCNEIGFRDDTSDAIFKHCKPAVEGGPARTYMIMNDDIVDKFGRKMFAFYQNVKGLVKRYENWDAFAADEKISDKKLKRTVELYNRYKDEGRDPFKKPRFPTGFAWDEPVYVAHITPCIHYSMGGLNFAKDSRVLTSTGKPIPNLFAAGEVGGGLHGKNRLGGNSLLECVVFGRRAGKLSVENQYAQQ